MSVFSSIRTEYENLRSEFQYSVRIQENTDQKKLRIWDTFHAVSVTFTITVIHVNTRRLYTLQMCCVNKPPNLLTHQILAI